MGTRALTAVAGGLLLLFNMNKFLAAAVAAEADPYILGYGGHGGYGLGYSGLHGLGYAGYDGYGGYGYATPVHHVAAVQNVAAVHAAAPIHNVAAVHAAVPGVVGARTYAGAGRYVANSAGTVHVAKREADPYYAGYNGIGYAGYGGYGLGYSGLQGVGYAGYGGYGTAPVVHAVAPIGYGAVGHNAGVYGYASPVHHGYNHAANTQVSPSASLSIAGAARYVANSAGTVHVA